MTDPPSRETPREKNSFTLLADASIAALIGGREGREAEEAE